MLSNNLLFHMYFSDRSQDITRVITVLCNRR
ncbi:hypothetical protein GBAR_LOCUS8707 [Geodia barretti]|uniref:Uncharacterized protein n=1 Tax=Geodia barretti TaxID=519541 RepID=A0AA35R4B2_GEOBA|nr:hypothetical protein GBAR_LOCUS3726 [Geodia barretti]CAI8013817.1 hypothetical protein GBAR_LOCUS8707 [Geodia barretti]